jgi:hypothetical protein
MFSAEAPSVLRTDIHSTHRRARERLETVDSVRVGGSTVRPITRDRYEEVAMGDKSPKKENAKKPSKTLKEKRADKQARRDAKPSR